MILTLPPSLHTTFPFLNLMVQAHQQAKKRKMREIRGGGKNAKEEGAEEENEFEEDEEVEDEDMEATLATADATTDAATTDAATADATTDAATADATTDAATADAATASSTLKRDGSNEEVNELSVVRRARGKTSAARAATPLSTPSPVHPRRLFSGSSLESLPSPTSSEAASSGRRRQATISRFFSPQSGRHEDAIDDEPEPLPKKPTWRIADTVRALIQMGTISDQGHLIQPGQSLVRSLAAAVQSSDEYKKQVFSRGGRPLKKTQLRGVAGGLKSNMRLKGQRKLRDELPIAFKHEMCQQIQEMKIEHASEADAVKAAARKYKMKPKKIKQIWNQRLEWKKQMQQHKTSDGKHARPLASGAMRGSHGPLAAKQARLRASGGGRKLTFPKLYEKVKIWLEEERSHGHTVLRRHVAWKFHEYLASYRSELALKEADSNISNAEKIELQAADKMLQGIDRSQGNADKRADHLIKWMGAKLMQPNLVTQLSEIEMQVRAELTWQHHDYLIWKIAGMKDEDYHEMFARPDQAKQQMRTCALCFSDQVPLWVKKPSAKEVFAKFELKTSDSSTKAHRKNISDRLEQKAVQKALAIEEGGDEQTKDQQIVEHEGDADEWQIGTADDQATSGKKHLTTMREANSDKYRITFEAHQMVSGFFNPDQHPQGHVMPGILIVPGPHAAMSNISEKGEWISDEKYYHCGQMRTHKKGSSVGRTLEPWRKLRKSHPELLRHFFVYSQPSSNTDGVIMSWVIRDMSSRLGMRLHQRDMFGAAFVDEVRNMQFLGHEVAANIMSKMTASMQLTDTDFAHEFKSQVKHKVDECMREGMAKQRVDEAAPSDHYKMSIKDVATAIDSAMEHMVQKNEKDQWVLAGLRRNGFLLFRPNEKGQLIYQTKQDWCKHLPIGPTRISENWLKNRMSWIKDAGHSVDPPNWERISGAKELADLIEWSYQTNQGSSDPANETTMTWESVDTPEWVTAGQFQLPLELRRQLALKEKNMSEDALKRRDKMRQKRADRKMRADAKKILTEEQREEIRSTLASSSRHEAMGQLVPSAKNPTAKHLAKKKLKNAKKMLKMTAEKKKHKAEQKKGVKQALKNEALKAFKEKAKKTSEKESGHQPPLPPPNEPPPASDEAPAAPDEAPPASDEAMPSGTFRVVKEHAGMLLYGRQGAVMGMGEDQLQLLLEKDARNSIERLAWVNKSWLLEISDEEKKKSWTFPQVTLSRQIRQHILVQTGAVSEDIEDEMWISDEVELIGKEVPANGIDQMHILFGWHVLCYMASGKQFDGIPGITLLDPSISCPLALPAADQRHEPDLLQKLKQLVIQKMSKNEGTFLIPLAAGGHWSLLVIDKPSRKIRYYDSLAGSDEKADIGTIEEIKNLHA